MKFLSFFKNKVIVSLLTVAVSVIVIASSALSIMLPSYFSWKEYYDAAIKEREHQKYLQSLPLELLGISAALSDAVKYYANGKANPINDHFIVTAHFTEKGKDFDRILRPSDFEMTVPEDFALEGGTIEIGYTYVPETEEGETSEPVVKTAEVECELEQVVPLSLELVEMPYRVYYSNQMSFDLEGLKAKVIYNDGSEEELFESEFTASAQNLTAGAQKVTVTWERGGTTLNLDVPVTVVQQSQYNDGYIIALRPEGDVFVAEGELTSEARPRVRATYQSGNRLLLNSEHYTVVGNTERATFTKKCVLSLYLADNPAIFTRTAAIVRSAAEAEDAVLTNAQSGQVQEYTYDGSNFTSAGNVTVVNPVNGSKISFILSCDALSKPDLYVRMALKQEGSLVLSDVMTMTVNGRSVFIPDSAVISSPEGANGKAVFFDVRLPSAVLNKDEENSVEIQFISSDAQKLAIDRIMLEAGYKGQFYLSTEDYLVAHSQAGESAEFVNTIVKSFGLVGGKPYGHGICSDGTYLYITATSYSDGLRALRVQKYDPVTNTQVAVSADTEVAAREDCAGITYYDGKIIVYLMDGRRLYVNVNEFTDGCAFAQYDGFAFEDLETATLKDVYFNPSTETFAVFSGSNVYIYDKGLKKINNFAVPSDSAGVAKRMTGSADNIYISYTKDGSYSPVVRVFDWSGNSKGRMVVPISNSFLASNGVNDLTRTNIQGLAVINGDFYAIFLKFGSANGGDSTAFIKITMPQISEELIPELTFSEYLNACSDASVTPEFNAFARYGALGFIQGTSGYSMGGVSDGGTYIYVANNASGNSSTVISKIDLKTFTVSEKSAAFAVAASVSSGDNSRLFIKDGVLYCVAGDVYSIELNKFAQNCVIKKDDEMTALLGKGTKVLKSVYWDEAQRKYAVLDNSGSLQIVDEEGQDITSNIDAKYSDFKTSSICGDQYFIYVSHAKNIQTALPIDVYTWDGTKVTSLSISGINLGGSPNLYDYNIQTIFQHDGNIYASVCTWNSNLNSGYYLWAIDFDASLFYTE